VAGGDTLAFFKLYDTCGRELAVSSQRRQYLDKDGEIVHMEDMVQNMTSLDLVYYMLRANFDGVESTYCKVPQPVNREGNGQVRQVHGRKVTDVRLLDEDGRVELGYEDTTSEGQGKTSSMMADFVTGADGPSSNIRSILCPDVQRTYAGYVALRGTLPEEKVSPQPSKPSANALASSMPKEFRSLPTSYRAKTAH
jgi:2-polyprenyl-6-methoxyphenol hydroxylase-like FAD-dependent oxidoreductase